MVTFETLAFIWAGIIAFAVLAYILLDGFDLGVGILFPLFKRGEERDHVMHSVAPFWDGNETWLVMGGGGLLAVFPLAYSIILSALYPMIILMLLSLVFRGVAFEFRHYAERKYIWDRAFALGSTVAAFAQGVALGALVQGISVKDRAYAGGWWDWLTPFSVLTGVSLVVGYALLGSTWLAYKTSDDLRDKAVKYARVLAPALVGLIVVVSIWTLFINGGAYVEKWIGWPQILYTAPVPVLVIACVLFLVKSLTDHRHHLSFLATKALFILCYIGIGISFYPHMVPNSVTIWQAAAPQNSLSFLLTGAVFLLPIILAYNAYGYWVFRGKADTSANPH